MLGDYYDRPVERSSMVPRGHVVDPRDKWVLDLSIGIVKQAADDLRAALLAKDEGNIAALTKWFRSEWGQLLSFGHGGTIIRGLKKEAAEYDTDKT